MISSCRCHVLASLSLAIFLTGCATSSHHAPALPHGTPDVTEAPPLGQITSPSPQEGAALLNNNIESPLKVTLLIPLTGKDAKLGEAMQNAAQMAMTDLGYPNFELGFEDTQSNPNGARSAAKRASTGGSRLILGPIFADEVRAAKSEIGTAHIPMIAFSTDTSVAGGETYTIGILPQDQARQIAQFAAMRGIKRILVTATRDPYGQMVSDSFALAARRYGITVAGPIWIDGGNVGTLPMQLAAHFPAKGAQNTAPIDGVFMPLPADMAARLSRMLKTLPGAENIQRLGTGLLDDANLTTYPDLVGAFYAAPSPTARQRFEQLYTRNFGSKPPRLSSLGYDATALAIMLGRQNGEHAFTSTTLTNRAGFSGIDGLFRFGINGIAERGLAVLQIQPGGRSIVAPSPTQFTE